MILQNLSYQFLVDNYQEIDPEQSHYKTLIADITHRCNMECANCYIPNRDIPDMDLDRLYDLAKRLPHRTEFRLMGGEPTVRKELPDIISNIRKLGHRPTILTNGLKLGNFDYAKELYDAGLRSLNISMNGADDDNVYEVMDELRCADRKMAALRNVVKLNMFININCILQKGVNDHIPERLINIFKNEFPNTAGILRFRNVGQIGRYTLEKHENHTFDELITKFSSIVDKDPEYIKSMNVVEGVVEKYNVLFPLDETKKRSGIWIKITDWSPNESQIPDPMNVRRARITQNFKLAPFFEHVKLNEGGY